ncbi:unnamed protein product [Kluyveromyces dobzhanskii CBS 2104]|uniref:WGS project CCBQ000000000 data, contig 00017 n=1 Tax=Kluyveromyces dobzhanskii CBS 2104 TaxID=1427455 RepID=A0A0A8L8Q5_9SACH|nr:unnamed protein product [Kluyveromyces dobzhanskii CBS 2104]
MLKLMLLLSIWIQTSHCLVIVRDAPVVDSMALDDDHNVPRFKHYQRDQSEAEIAALYNSWDGLKPAETRFGDVFSSKYQFLDKVDVFYGTLGGHMFPGTAVPFGMCRMGVDVINSKRGDAYSGFQPDGSIVGISMLHESGTGGAPTYGAVSQLPMIASGSNAVDVTQQISFQRKVPDVAHVGYYKVELSNNISVEFSSKERSGLYEYTFPTLQGDDKPIIMVNVSQHLHSFGRPWWTQNFKSGHITASSDLKSYRGKVTIDGGWTDKGEWTVSFYGEFSKRARRVTSFRNGRKIPFLRRMNSLTDGSDLGLLFEFDQDTTLLQSHVGISFKKNEGVKAAKQNSLNDYPEGSRFNLTWSVESSLEAWNKQLFQKVEVNTDDEDPLIVSKLYNSLYGTHLMPSNKSGEDAPWETGEPYYDDWFTIWDTFRCLHPLINIVSQDHGAAMVRSLIDIWEKEGFMPDGRSGDRSGRTQGGSNSDIVLADAFIKNVKEGIDWEKGFQAMSTNAEVEPPYIEDPMARDSTNKFGRGALKEWLQLGYVTRKYSRSVTRTMEYSYNDFALYIVAKGLGKTELAQRYLQRSKNWRNIWNPEAVSANTKYNYKGFVQPKNTDGTFATERYDPFSCFGCYWADDEYEGKPVEYGWTVPFDMQELQKYIGSDAMFEKRLDDMYALHGHENLVNIGNEPSFLTPYLYAYINRQDKTSELVDWIVNTKFKTGPGGLPGNSDAGAMQAWLTFALMGFYPIAGTDMYLLTSPKLNYLKLKNMPNVPEVEIVAHNLYSDDHTRNIFIQKVVINGQELSRNWFRHSDLFEKGGKIEYFMSETALNWDTGKESPPKEFNV